MRLKYIVAGTGRCGSVYMARVLTSISIPCGHESIFNQHDPDIIIERARGTISPTISNVAKNDGWLNIDHIIADSSYMAIPYLNHPEIQHIPIIHIVREPLSVVSSFVKDLQYFNLMKNNPYNIGGWEEWIWSQLPELHQYDNALERACYFWTVWNEKIEESYVNRKIYFHNIENKFNDDFFDFVNVKQRNVVFNNKKENTMKKRSTDFTIDEIPSGKVKHDFLELREKYRYPILS